MIKYKASKILKIYFNKDKIQIIVEAAYKNIKTIIGIINKEKIF